MQSSPASEQNGPPGPGIEDLQARVDELDDRYRRALADLDNYRKRSERLADSRVADARGGTFTTAPRILRLGLGVSEKFAGNSSPGCNVIGTAWLRSAVPG